MDVAVSAPPRRHRLEPARPEHVGALVDLYEAFERERGVTVTAAERVNMGDAILASVFNPETPIVVAVNGKKVVGFVWVSERAMIMDRPAAHVRYLYVRPEYRGAVGYELQRVIERWAHERDLKIAFQVAHGDVADWERRGYRVLAVIMMEP